MKEIPLSQGYVALVDDEDYERMSQHKWRALPKPYGAVYAQRSTPRKDGKRSTVYLHRELVNAPRGMEVDHINDDGLDNRKSNLRICTTAQNQRNQRPYVGCSSQYRGVRWHKRDARWMVRIRLDGQQVHLGNFTDEQEAARAYDIAARKNFGEFARPNFPAPEENTYAE